MRPYIKDAVILAGLKNHFVSDDDTFTIKLHREWMIEMGYIRKSEIINYEEFDTVNKWHKFIYSLGTLNSCEVTLKMVQDHTRYLKFATLNGHKFIMN